MLQFFPPSAKPIYFQGYDTKQKKEKLLSICQSQASFAAQLFILGIPLYFL